MSENTQMASLRHFNQTLMNEKTKDFIKNALGKKADSYISNITTLVNNTAGLQNCDPLTIINAGLKATVLELSLEPSLGRAYVIPYGNVAQFQIGYKGFIELCTRSGYYEKINAREVRQGEFLSEDFRTGDIEFKFQPDREKLPVIGYMAYFKLKNGVEKTFYMTKKQCEEHGAKYSKTYKNTSGRWYLDFDGMALKTVLKLMLGKWGILSTEIQSAITNDQAVFKDFDSDPEYLDGGKEPTEREIEIARQITEKFGNKIKVDDIPATNFEEVSKTDSAQTENPELFKEHKK